MHASATPKLREWPTVPEEQHTERGESSGFMTRLIFSDRGEVPAYTEIVAGDVSFMKISPPFSIITSCNLNSARRSLHMYSAIVPATVLIGPVPAACAASLIELING